MRHGGWDAFSFYSYVVLFFSNYRVSQRKDKAQTAEKLQST